MPHSPKNGACSPRALELTLILEMLTRSQSARADLVADIRDQLDRGTYMSEAKLDLAIYRLLKGMLD